MPTVNDQAATIARLTRERDASWMECECHRDIMKYADSPSAMTSLDERRRNCVAATDAARKEPPRQ